MTGERSIFVDRSRVDIAFRPSEPLTRRWRLISSPAVREMVGESRSYTDDRTGQHHARGKALNEQGRAPTQLVAVEWEDITAYSRTALPEDFEPYRLRKLTCGLLWKDTPEYVVVVGDYDITNEGREYRHNDFHIIPRGVIRQLTYLRESSTPLVALQAEESAS